MKRVTIVDVAHHAGTSTAVVSYVLNPGTKPVSDTLRARVLAAVSELDYRPDRHARALRRRTRWGQIGLIIPDVTLPFYGMLAGAIETEGRRRHQLVMTGNTGFDADAERELTQSFADAGVGSLLVAGVADGRAVSAICAEARIPLVWVHNNRGVVGTRIVCSDHVRAGRLAAAHLAAEHDCARIVFVGGFADAQVQHGDRDTARERYEGCVSAVGARVRQIPTDLTLDGAYRAVSADIRAHGAPDGIVVGTFLQSAATLRALADAGIRVPADVPVVTFDGDARNRYAHIRLSTVQQNITEIAARSIDLALQSAAEADEGPERSPVSLEIAESCGCGAA